MSRLPSRSRRSLPRTLVPLLTALAVGLTTLAAAPGAVAGTRSSHSQSRQERPRFSHAQARHVLAQAREQLQRKSPSARARAATADRPGTDLSLTLRDLFLARTSLTGSDRRAADRILSRPDDGSGDDLGDGGPAVEYPPNSTATPWQTYDPQGGVAVIHWVGGTTSAQRVTNTTDADHDGVPDYVEAVYATVSHVYRYETGTMHYAAPRDDSSATDHGPNGKIDVYLADLGSRALYGYCAPDGADPYARHQPGYCVLDNDYAYRQYRTHAWLDELRVTAAHEFFHAVQFGYDAFEDSWFMESTAMWMEDEVYDSVNDNVHWLGNGPLRQPRIPLDYTMHRYGSWLFFRYVSERLGRDTVRQFWNAAEASKGRYSLQAIRAVLAWRHVSWGPFFATFGAWNTLPPGSYSERARYPRPVYTLSATLGRHHKATAWKRVNLMHLTNSAARFAPGTGLRRHSRLVIQVHTPPPARGGVVEVQRRYRNGHVGSSLVRLSRKGVGQAVVDFNPRTVSSVVVVASNTSTAMHYCGPIGDQTFSCNGEGVYDAHQAYAVRASVR